MKTKHTPGPWNISNVDNGYHIYACDKINAVDHPIIFELCHIKDNSKCKANAKLIAAAPELLEALLIAYSSANKNVQRIIDNVIRKATE